MAGVDCVPVETARSVYIKPRVHKNMNDGHLFFTYLWSRARTGGRGPCVRGTAAEGAPTNFTTVSARPTEGVPAGVAQAAGMWGVGGDSLQGVSLWG
jgi:hypothetical protein